MDHQQPQRTEREPRSLSANSYQGDAARIYADGILVEYNFWNGKPTLVRLSDLIGKHVELKILPFGKGYPIYLQAKEKEAGLPYPSLTLAFLAPDFAQSKDLLPTSPLTCLCREICVPYRRTRYFQTDAACL